MTTEKATPPGIALDNEALDKLEALARAATPGPWHWVNSDNDKPRQPGEWRASLRTVQEYPTRSVGPLPKFIVEADEINDENMESNAAFIAAANPATMLKLVAQARAAQPQPSAAPDDLASARRSMFMAFSECFLASDKMLPQEIADKLLAAAPSPNFAARGAEPAGMQAAGVVEDWKTRMVKYGQTEDIAIRAEIADLRAQLSAARQGQPTAAPTPHEQEARAAVPSDADCSKLCEIFRIRGRENMTPSLTIACRLADLEYALNKARDAQAGMLPVAQTDAARDVLEPVDGDLLPPVGSKVLIHLARQDAWIEHTVAGYYVWPALRHQVQDGEKDAHRVFVRVMDARGYDNARLLSEVRIAAKGAAGLEGGAGGAS